VRDSPFYKQAELMLRAMPAVAAETRFALKGGTAINLFVRDMPRLSVDIDLTYLPLEPRQESLQHLGEALEHIGSTIEETVRPCQAHRARDGAGNISKLIVRTADAQVVVEPNTVLRGTIFPCEERELVRSAQDLFALSVTVNTLSLPDLYGGKLVAALDRQHPRDLFDVKLLVENEGITDDIRRAFVVYLASHDRPMNELIDPVRKDFRQVFETQFAGLTAAPVTYEELAEARESMIHQLCESLTLAERQFLVSIKEGKPRWELLGLEGIERLPGIQWKLQNIAKMSPKKHAAALEMLKARLGL
jgi:predicted nucleotidyltransferase component of viral defense system